MFPDSLGWVKKDYVQLINCAVLGMFKPEHWLMFCTVESGLDPRRQSKYAPAKGLWQALPSTLKNLGYFGEDFTTQPPDVQIKWSLKYLDEWRKRFRFEDWKRPGDMYLCNFAPAHLPHKEVPSWQIFTYAKHPETYWVNRGLDKLQAGHPKKVLAAPPKYAKDPNYVGKGYINVADMTLALQSVPFSSRYRQAVKSLNKLLQEGLNAADLGQPKLVVDGVVGPVTNAALAKWWEMKDVPLEFRQVDAYTRQALIV